jgi:hypothetical protein
LQTESKENEYRNGGMMKYVCIIVLVTLQFGITSAHLKGIKKQNISIDEKIDVIGELVDECQEQQNTLKLLFDN